MNQCDKNDIKLELEIKLNNNNNIFIIIDKNNDKSQVVDI
jgi:hypothetical protein